MMFVRDFRGWGEGNGVVLVKGYKVPVMQDDEIAKAVYLVFLLQKKKKKKKNWQLCGGNGYIN